MLSPADLAAGPIWRRETIADRRAVEFVDCSPAMKTRKATLVWRSIRHNARAAADASAQLLFSAASTRAGLAALPFGPILSTNFAPIPRTCTFRLCNYP